jgi:membrane protein
MYLLFDAAKEWLDKSSGFYSAAFSYYAPLALIPLIVFSIYVVGFFYGINFTNLVFTSWGSVMGDDLVELIKQAVSNLNTETGTANIPVLAVTFFLGFYVVAFNVLAEGFEKLWHLDVSGFKNFMSRSFRSVLFLFALQVYLIFIVGLEFFVAPAMFGTGVYISQLLLLGSTLLLFSVLYKFLVKNGPKWKSCLVGAAVSSVFFVIIKILVDFYIVTTPALNLYGAASILLILLVWVYVLAAIIFYGAAVAGVHGKMNKI